MTIIAFCSVFSDLSNEMLFKKIRCEMTENEWSDKKTCLIFIKNKKHLLFLKTLYLGQKKFFSPKSLVVVVSQ